jgi:hypoxanthine phosphoribosyltransferase
VGGGGCTLCRIICYVYFRTVLFVVNIVLWSNVFVKKSSLNVVTERKATYNADLFLL